ncbi:MAG: hypothetical protein JRC86_00405 [Deltaproteobacteria bacterium]|nr:hypothetical protein [Deltaproteobacteria bacterium]
MVKWRMVIKSPMDAEENMVQVATEPWASDKIRTSLLETEPDEHGNYLTEVWVDNTGKKNAIIAHGYEVILAEEEAT